MIVLACSTGFLCLSLTFPSRIILHVPKQSSNPLYLDFRNTFFFKGSGSANWHLPSLADAHSQSTL